MVNFRAGFLLVVLSLAACDGAPTSATTTTTSRPASAAPTLPAGEYAVDCAARGCPTIDPGRAPGDPRTNRISGFADPSIRRGSDGVLWMAYSVPSTGDRAGGALRVDTALARSDDDGATWEDEGILWATDVGTDANTVHEVPNLAVTRRNGLTQWYGIRLDYGVARGGARDWSALNLVLVAASTPLGLATSTAIVSLGAERTRPDLYDVDLTSVGDAGDRLARCDAWNEPALHVERTTLHLVVRCLALAAGGAPIDEDSDLLVFSADISASPSSPDRWTWRYDGVLAGAAHAEALDERATGLTQVDVATGPDGELLAIVTVDSFNRTYQNFEHYGCFVVEASLDEPGLVGTGDQLRIRASATASDNEPLGPGACTYVADAEVGLVLVRRDFSSGQGFGASLHDAGPLAAG